MITAVVLITAERGALPKIGEDLAAIPGVSEVYSVTGEIDFVAMGRAREHEELADIVTRRIAQVGGVARTFTQVAVRAYSRLERERGLGRGDPRWVRCADPFEHGDLIKVRWVSHVVKQRPEYEITSDGRDRLDAARADWKRFSRGVRGVIGEAT